MKNSLYNERKYLLLRKKLDELHYSLPLQIESAELVDKLLNDLLKTSDGFQKLKKQNEEYLAQIDFNERSLNPLKSDNQKLLRENNTLHSEIISAKENALEKQNILSVRLKSIENEVKDLKFVLQQTEARARQYQDENIALKNKMDTICAKVYLPSCEKGYEDLPKTYVNANVKSITNLSIARDNREGLQGILQGSLSQKNSASKEEDIQRLMNSGNSNYSGLNGQNNAEFFNKFKGLQDELRHAKEQVLQKESELQYLRMQVSNRNSEISRLTARLDVGGINMVKLVQDYNQMQQSDKIKLLSHQIDYLNKENTQMDSVLRSKPYIALSEANIKLQTENSSFLERLRTAEQKIQEYERKFDVKQQSGRFQKYSTQNINLQGDYDQ